MKLAHESLRTRLALGVVLLPVLFIKLAHGVLHLAQTVFNSLHLVAGDFADLIPAVLDSGERALRPGAVGFGEKRLGFGEECEL